MENTHILNESPTISKRGGTGTAPEQPKMLLNLGKITYNIIISQCLGLTLLVSV
jgi:hypothetical protein